MNTTTLTATDGHLSDEKLEALIRFGMLALAIRAELARHDLHYWDSQVGTAVSTAGSCNTTRRKITISGHVAAMNPPADTLDTIRHEIAHALVFEKYGQTVEPHGPEWAAMCRRTGAQPNATHTLNTPQPRWAVVCPNCGVIGHRHRRTSGIRRCVTCHTQIGWLDTRFSDQTVDYTPVGDWEGVCPDCGGRWWRQTKPTKRWLCVACDKPIEWAPAGSRTGA